MFLTIALVLIVLWALGFFVFPELKQLKVDFSGDRAQLLSEIG